MKKESKSILKAKKIEKYIRNKYSPTEYNVNIFDRGESVNIQIETTTKREGFKVITPMVFESEDLYDITNKILEKKGIKSKNLRTVIKHNDGDSREHMDYGTFEFVGVRFVWDDE